MAKKNGNEKVELEERKLEKEIAGLNVKLKEMERKLNDLETAQPEVSPRKSGNPRMTSFDLVNAIGSFRADFTGQPLGSSTEVFKWGEYPVVATVKSVSPLGVTVFVSDGNERCVSLHLEYQNEDNFRATFKHIPNVYYLFRHLSPSVRPLCFKAFSCFGSGHKFKGHTITNRSLEIYVESPFMTQQVHSYDGTLNWNLNDFRSRRQMEVERAIEFQESPYFYTGANGYRVRVHLRLNGSGVGMAADICFLTGEFDGDLTESFLHQTTVTVVDQLDTQFNIIKTVEKNLVEEKCYSVDVCDIKQMLYAVKNDTLKINVTIKAI